MITRVTDCRSFAGGLADDQLENEPGRVAHPVMAHVSMPVAQGQANRILGELGSENMRAHIAKRSKVRVEIEPGQNVTRPMPLGQGANARPEGRRELSHLVVAVDVGAEQRLSRHPPSSSAESDYDGNRWRRRP